VATRIAIVHTKKDRSHTNETDASKLWIATQIEALQTAGVPTMESWDAVKNQQHSESQECRAITAQILAMKPKREIIPRSHRGTFIPVMRTEE